MKKLFFFSLTVITCQILTAQNVGIGTSTPNNNAALEIKSTNKGLLMPRVSNAGKNAMVNVPKGMIVYDTTYSSFYYHDGSKWRSITDNNPDSMVTDYSSNPQVTANMNPSATTYAVSGILYDNGGPAGNYASNSDDNYYVIYSGDDSSVLYKVVVEQMNLESPYDSLLIFEQNNYDSRVSLTGTTTGTYYFPATTNLQFSFKSNTVNNLSGFRIRWSRVVPVASSQPPLYGWYFNPTKLAVRGGVASGSNWATDSLGRLSFSFGGGTKATGENSFAFGDRARATADNSFAAGIFSTASGLSSLAIGQSTLATGSRAVALGMNTQSSGFASTALGYSTIASSTEAVAMGSNTTASGGNSTAMGYFSTASGNYSTAMGQNTTAGGLISTALGVNTSASGNRSIAMGVNTVASGERSTAMGLSSIASGENSTAMGQNSTASGYASTAMGHTTIATGDYSIAMGSGTEAYGSYSTAMGSGTDAFGNYSTAMGRNTSASGLYSSAMGFNIISRGHAGTAIGIYNNPILPIAQALSPTTPLFIIGNGDDDANRSNALVVLKNGYMGVGTDAPKTKLHVDGGTDASLSDNSGFLIVGDIDGTNIVVDNNEIMARNNGATTTLFLQNSGGAFEIGGTAAKPGGGSWAATSDARLKQNVKSYTDGLQQLLKINPVYYQYNQQSGYNTQHQYIGVLAQEIKEVAPYMVGTFTKNNTEYLNVDNSAMTYMLINAVKEQQKQIEELKALVKALLDNK